MPKIYFSEADRLAEKELTALHAELFAHGIRNKKIAAWLGCSEQNVSQLWKNCSFSFKQILVIKQKLKEVTESTEV